MTVLPRLPRTLEAIMDPTIYLLQTGDEDEVTPPADSEVDEQAPPPPSDA